MKTGGEKSPPEVVPKTPGLDTPIDNFRFADDPDTNTLLSAEPEWTRGDRRNEQRELLENYLQPKLYLARIEGGLERQWLGDIEATNAMEVIRPVPQRGSMAVDGEFAIRIDRKRVVHGAEVRVIQNIGSLHHQIKSPPRVAVEEK